MRRTRQAIARGEPDAPGEPLASLILTLVVLLALAVARGPIEGALRPWLLPDAAPGLAYDPAGWRVLEHSPRVAERWRSARGGRHQLTVADAIEDWVVVQRYHHRADGSVHRVAAYDSRTVRRWISLVGAVIFGLAIWWRRLAAWDASR